MNHNIGFDLLRCSGGKGGQGAPSHNRNKDLSLRGVTVRPPKRPERDVQAAILELLHARGVPAWPMNRESGVRRKLDNAYIAAKVGGPGFADIIGILPAGREMFVGRIGRFLAIEAKAPGARTSRARAGAQRAFGFVVTDAGGLYIAIDPQSALTGPEQVCQALGWTWGAERAHA